MESWKNYEHERDAPMIARYCKWDWFFVRIIDRKVWWKYLPHYCHRHCKCYNHTHWMLLGLGIEPTKASDRQKQLWSNLSSSMPFLSEQRGSPTDMQLWYSLKLWRCIRFSRDATSQPPTFPYSPNEKSEYWVTHHEVYNIVIVCMRHTYLRGGW